MSKKKAPELSKETIITALNGIDSLPHRGVGSSKAVIKAFDEIQGYCTAVHGEPIPVAEGPAAPAEG